jgi:pyruvate/2-oxoacid:ferredoxin oxidoreductase beta subunit
MSDRKTSISIHYPFGQIGADTAAIAPGVRRATDVEHRLAGPVLDQAKRSPLNPERESSVVVYCGDAQQVSEGFAIALLAMGVVASIQNREGN